MLNLFIGLALFCLVELSLQQTITWTDTCNRNLTNGLSLIHNHDLIILNGEIYLGKNREMDRAQYEIKKLNSDFKTLCYLDLSKCEGYKHSYCYCKTTIAPNIVDVVVNVTADKTLSEATVRGTLYNFDSRIVSKELIIPKIYDPSIIDNAKVYVYINGRIINSSKCEETIAVNSATIAFHLSDTVNVQYILTVQDVNTGRIQTSENNLMFYSTQVEDKLNLIITYEILDATPSRRSFECTISSSDGGNTMVCLTVLIPLVCGLILIILIVLSIVIIKYRLCINKTFTGKQVEQNYKQADIAMTSSLETDETEKLIDNKAIAETKLYQDKETEEVYKQNQNIKNENESSHYIPKDVFSKINNLKGKKDNKKMPLLKRLSKRPKDDALIDLVQYQLETMVSVEVQIVSNRRPKCWPGSKKPYPLFGEEKCKRKGYGRIVSVKKITHFDKHRSYMWRTPLSKLFTKLKNQSSEMVEVLILISRHLIFDDYEAEQTLCTLIINKENEQNISFHGVTVRMANVDENWTLLTCISEDVSIYEYLNQKIHHFNLEWQKLDTSNLVSFFIFEPDMTTQKAHFGDLCNIVDNDFKTSSFFLNTYFEQQNMAIYIEKPCTRYEEIPQIKKDFSNQSKSKTVLSAMPLIIQKTDPKFPGFTIPLNDEL